MVHSRRLLGLVPGVALSFALFLSLASPAQTQEKATENSAKSVAAKDAASKGSSSADAGETPATPGLTAEKTGTDSPAAKGTKAAPKAKKAKATKAKSAQSTRKTKAPTRDEKDEKTKTEKATFGAGCFWSVEAVFERVPGVKSVVSGFSGGNVKRPSYDMVCTGETGHAEAVQVTYDPAIVTYEKLLEVFWHVHDPTQLNKQGADFGTQYRSAIFYLNDDQKAAALKSYQDLVKTGAYASPIVTKLLPYKVFYPAEAYHQNYFRNHLDGEYSQNYIVPKLRKLSRTLHLK